MGIIFRVLRALLLSRRTTRLVTGPAGLFLVRRLQRWPLVGLGASLALAIVTRSPVAIALAATRAIALARRFRRRL